MLTPPDRRAAAQAMADRLGSVSSFAVCTHVNGDGDGWGSACALAHHFLPAGVDVRLLAATPLPTRYSFLLPRAVSPLAPNEDGVRALRTADLQVVVDASESGRLGAFADHFEPGRTLVIDHHPVPAEPVPSALSLVDPGAAASAELVHDVLAATATPIGVDTARSLYVGLVTDTGSFRYSNTSAHSHRLAAELIDLGVDPEALYRPLFANLTATELGTLQEVLSRIQRDEALGLTWSSLTLDAPRRRGVLEEYEGIIDHLRNLEGTEIAALFREREGGGVKVSLRSTGAANVAAIARRFGGGGHERAAGATLEGDLSSVIEAVVSECRAALGGGSEDRP